MATEMSFITFSQAAQRLGVSIKALTATVNSAKIKVAKTPIGGMIAEDDVAKIEKRDWLWKQVKKLDSKPISMLKASQDYGISLGTLRQWVNDGYIRTLSGGGKRGRGHTRMLNQADVAYASLLLEERGGKRPGKRLFTSDVLPPHIAQSTS
jgi:predicted site-specific integrase-resolvase